MIQRRRIERLVERLSPHGAMVVTLRSLLNEQGSRWMEPDEQFRAFPESKELRPFMSRPVWLVCSVVARERGYIFENGLAISGQMNNIRKALGMRCHMKTR